MPAGKLLWYLVCYGMMMAAGLAKTVAKFGEWQSPITSSVVAGKTVELSYPSVTPTGQVYWLESRPLEEGRQVLVTRKDGGVVTITPPVESGVNVRTRVHEYGGSSYLIVGDDVYFSNYEDQRLYRQSLKDPAAGVVPVTAANTSLRFADYIWNAVNQRLISVVEDHSGGGEAVNTISTVDGKTGNVTTLASGADFYMSPALDPTGTKLAWIQWKHPNMPWDGTELYVGELAENGTKLVNIKLVAGGPQEAAQQPQWGEDGSLYYVSDPTGWWNLYKYTTDGQTIPLYPSESEFGVIPWTLGRNSYVILPGGKLLVIYHSPTSTNQTLGVLDPEKKEITALTTGFESYGMPSIKVAQLQDGKKLKVVVVGSTPTTMPKVVSLEVEDVDGLVNSTPADWVVQQIASEVQIPSSFLSVPQSLSFPTTNGEVAYMYYYPPTNPDFQGPPGEKPPLMINSHGGPTASATTDLYLQFQYFTSRGYAVADVNYRGSTGYGRAYRNKLRGQWGVVDVEDSTNAAVYLGQQGVVDPKKLTIVGESAGGFTTLACLAFKDVFSVGASIFGIGNLELLANGTHKFESHYLDSMVGPYPDFLEVYRQRSPALHVEGFNAPIIFFQGTDDKVVPPNQSVEMYNAVKAKGLTTALVLFEGEQHGFTRAESIRTTLDGILYFFGKVLGYNVTWPEDLPPIQIDNLQS